MGGLGRSRTFIVYDRTAGLKLPTDLAGVSAATFEPHANGNLQSALGAAATLVEEQVGRLGVRDRERFKQLSEAAQGFDSAAAQMQKLVELIARSRKVELDIISTQFGPLIDPDKLSQINRDLSDLEETLHRRTVVLNEGGA
jgi:hypothetical protein